MSLSPYLTTRFFFSELVADKWNSTSVYNRLNEYQLLQEWTGTYMCYMDGLLRSLSGPPGPVASPALRIRLRNRCGRTCYVTWYFMLPSTFQTRLSAEQNRTLTSLMYYSTLGGRVNLSEKYVMIVHRFNVNCCLFIRFNEGLDKAASHARSGVTRRLAVRSSTLTQIILIFVYLQQQQQPALMCR